MARTINTQLMSATKIVMFILLEMMCFPLYCGILIDLCTLPIFSNHATIQSRIALFQDYPWMFVMVHWVIGSIFMFQFAMYVSTIRAVVRPGLMWFVRDPNDPEFNALREILRRPIKSQLRKLSIGALMYGFLTFSVLGAGIRFLVMTDYLVNQIIGPKSVFKMFPLRLEYFDGVSEIPFDLFFFHFILPQALKFVELDAKFKTVVKIWFVTVAKMLRLSHFLMGERVLEEEDFHTFESHLENGNVSVIDPITMAAPSKKGKSPATETVDEYGTNTTSIVGADNEWNDDIPMNDFSNDEKKTWIRVPNIDNIDIIPGEKMLIWMKPSDPVFGRANETPEEVARKWTKVFAPENFYPRVNVSLTTDLLLIGVAVVFAIFNDSSCICRTK